MCGRFTLTWEDHRRLAAELDALVHEEDAALYRPRYNVGPLSRPFIVAATPPPGRAPDAAATRGAARFLQPARWGLLPRWAKAPSDGARLINARAESAAEKPAFRDPFRRRRCVVPADGFLEWTGPKGARRPMWFHAPPGGLLRLAGLYEDWREPGSGDVVRTFTILTTAANDVVAPVHDRMPVILAREAMELWLTLPADADPARLAPLLRPAPPDALRVVEVSRRVSSVAHDDPACLEPVHEPGGEAAPAPSRAGLPAAAGRGGEAPEGAEQTDATGATRQLRLFG